MALTDLDPGMDIWIAGIFLLNSLSFVAQHYLNVIRAGVGCSRGAGLSHAPGSAP
jgi:hypothetical protein